MTRSILPVGVILAGGRSSRMGGVHKALLQLAGQTLLGHVISRLQPQLHSLLLSTEQVDSRFDRFGLPQVPDVLPRYRGPLTGLCSAMQYLGGLAMQTGVMLCPCDAPFLPENIVVSLQRAALTHGATRTSLPVAVISYQGVLQPTFSLWQAHHFPVVYEAVAEQGRGGLKQVLAGLPLAVLEWEEVEPSPFYNINTPTELASAAEWLERLAEYI